MIRARVWFRCAAMHDPVNPRVVSPAVIGWFGKSRQIDLTIEREFTGAELLRRMKGWITVNPKEAIELLESHGRLKVFDDGELVIEIETEEEFDSLTDKIVEHFKGQCNLERI
ncbi:MAG: hypothetical protein P4L38_04425 [Syntrophaceae bacterium]|nr:hypothetical protein [Syntrophaceae bacterium]